MTVFGHSVSCNHEFTSQRHGVGEVSDTVARPFVVAFVRPFTALPLRIVLSQWFNRDWEHRLHSIGQISDCDINPRRRIPALA